MITLFWIVYGTVLSLRLAGKRAKMEVVAWILAAIVLGLFAYGQDRHRQEAERQRDEALERLSKGIQTFQTAAQGVLQACSGVPARQPAERPDLRTRALDLSRDLIGWVGERQAAEARLVADRTIPWDTRQDQLSKFFADTMAEYAKRFAGNVASIKAEFEASGVKTQNPMGEALWQYPTNLLGILEIGQELSAMAWRLPDKTPLSQTGH